LWHHLFSASWRINTCFKVYI